MSAEAIRPAATVVLWRKGADGPEVLMGQRGAGAAFMPSKYVFPGGAVDPADHEVALAALPDPTTLHRLSLVSDGPAPAALAAAAIRELWEETGLALATPTPFAPPSDSGEDWSRLAALGLCPDASTLRFIFRAVTPPGRTRRFDARFFLAPEAALAPATHSASGELAHLHWIGLNAARTLDLPFITEVVLAEVADLLGGGHDHGVPFFDNRGDRPTFRRLL